MADNQIFISYSRRNSAFVERLMADLKVAGFELWRDAESLVAGTPSWERAIRSAIKNSGAVVLVASPDSYQSDYVQGELTVGKLSHRPVFPIWADGEDWVECVPLDMVNYQYVDGRGDNYDSAVGELIDTLKSVFDTKKGVITLGLPTHETVQVNLAQFKTGLNLLTYIWHNHLNGWYESLAYGREWIVANVDTHQLAIPWEWLTINRNDDGLMTVLNLRAGMQSYTEFAAIKDGSYWAIWDARRVKAMAILLNDDALYNRILSKNGALELPILVKEGILKKQTLDDTKPAQYKHHIVMATFSDDNHKMAFVEI